MKGSSTNEEVQKKVSVKDKFKDVTSYQPKLAFFDLEGKPRNLLFIEEFDYDEADNLIADNPFAWKKCSKADLFDILYAWLPYPPEE